MQRILKAITHRKSELDLNILCKWLKNDQRDCEDRFTIVPVMLYFIMGFKDILESLKYQTTASPLEEAVNQHCQEDLNHWQWYLEDIERLGYGYASWGKTPQDLFAFIWSDEAIEIREMVYLTIHFIKSNPSAEIHLVIIEALEASFASFIDAMHVPVKNHDLYDTLEFFGRTHADTEAAHQAGSWTEENAVSEDISQIRLSDNDYQSSRIIVNTLFDQFEEMFSSFYELRTHFNK